MIRKFLRRQAGTSVVIVMAFLGLATPLLAASLGMAGTLSRDSRVKNEIMTRQYTALAVQEYVRYIARDPDGWNDWWTSTGGEDSLTVNGETIDFTVTNNTDMCLASSMGSAILGNLVIPDGATCTLLGASVQGNVQVEPGGALAMLWTSVSDTGITGNLYSDGARWIMLGCSGPDCLDDAVAVTICSDVFDTDDGCVRTSFSPGSTQEIHVGGNIQIEGTTGTPPGFAANYICNRVTINGNLYLEGNTAPFEIGGRDICTAFGEGESGNTIHGNVEITNNTVISGPAVKFSDNTVDGNLTCTDNSLPTTGVAGSNTVSGNKIGECSGL